MAGKERKGIPGWGIALIVILVILVILTVLLIIAFVIGRRLVGEANDTINDGLTGVLGVGSDCTNDDDCPNGLPCVDGKCSIPTLECPKPNVITGISDNQTLNFPGWDVELTWNVDVHANAYFVFLGLADGFNPFEEAIMTQLTASNTYTFVQLDASTTYYVYVVGFSEDCGLNTTLEPEIYSFNTGPII